MNLESAPLFFAAGVPLTTTKQKGGAAMVYRWKEDGKGNFVSGDRGAYEWSKTSPLKKFLTGLLVAAVWTAIVAIGIALRG